MPLTSLTMRVAHARQERGVERVDVGGHAVDAGHRAQARRRCRRCGSRPSRRPSSPAAAPRTPARSRRRARRCGSPRGRSRRPCAGCRSAPWSPRRGCGWRGRGRGTGGGRRTPRRPSSRPSARTSSLNNSRKRLDQLHVHPLGQAADVVVALDRHRRPAGEADALDHVGIERALGEEIGAADLVRFLLEHVDEFAADELALGLGVGDARPGRPGTAPRRPPRPAGCCNGRGTGFRPARARSAAAGRDRRTRRSAGRRSPRGSGPPRPSCRPRRDRPQITLPVADLGADFGDLGVAIVGHRPVAGQPAHVVDEVGDQLARRRACGSTSGWNWVP